MAELIKVDDSLNDGRKKLNEAIKDSNKAKQDASEALNTANTSINQSESTQDQLDNIIINSGTSDAEVIQARTDEKGATHATLKKRIDDSVSDITTQLAETAEMEGYNKNATLEINENYVALPSAIGNDLATHPSVKEFENGWNGYKYWMAYTPYPGVYNENPSIACSNDGVNWRLPTGAPNPITGPPEEPAYYSDTELVYLEDEEKLRIYFRRTRTSAGGDQILITESINGVDWSDPQVIIDTTDLTLSPSVVRNENDDGWLIYTVKSKTEIQMRESTDGINWGNPLTITQPWSNWSAWHIGVAKDSEGTYHLMGSTWEVSGSGTRPQFRPIVYAYSDDGENFTPIEKPQLIPSGWAGGYLYRPSFVIDESKGKKEGLPYIKLWYGAKTDAVAEGWHVGYTEGYLVKGDDNASITTDKTKRKKNGEFFKLFGAIIKSPLAMIERLITKRLVIKSDYSQPIVEIFDGRVGRDGGNRLRIEYQGAEDPKDVRLFFIFFDDDENYNRIIIQPHNNFVEFPKGTKLGGISGLDSSGEFTLTETDGNNRFNLLRYSEADDKFVIGKPTSVRIGNYVWGFEADGALNADKREIRNLKAINFGGTVGDNSALNGSIYAGSDGKLKYKDLDGNVHDLT